LEKCSLALARTQNEGVFKMTIEIFGHKRLKHPFSQVKKKNFTRNP
jgi:hypothetical protein